MEQDPYGFILALAKLSAVFASFSRNMHNQIKIKN